MLGRLWLAGGCGVGLRSVVLAQLVACWHLSHRSLLLWPASVYPPSPLFCFPPPPSHPPDPLPCLNSLFPSPLPHGLRRDRGTTSCALLSSGMVGFHLAKSGKSDRSQSFLFLHNSRPPPPPPLHPLTLPPPCHSVECAKA